MADGRKRRTSNLVPPSSRTAEERAEIGRKGGIKSGETRRRKKAVKEKIQTLLDMRVKAPRDVKATLKRIGYDIEAEGDPTIELMIQLAIANQAMTGDIQSARFLYDDAQVPDMRAQLERERIKAGQTIGGKMELAVSAAEAGDIMAEVQKALADGAESAGADVEAAAGGGLEDGEPDGGVDGDGE